KFKMLANDSTDKEDQTDLSDEDDLYQETDISEEEDEDNKSDTSLGATNEGEALQIVTSSGPKYNSKAPFEIILNKENLLKILGPAKDNPICILGIAGPPNNGKNWHWKPWKMMTRISVSPTLTILLTDFTGCSPNGTLKTKEHWAWHKPFIIDVAGKDIAVILLDSQGLDDDRMTPEEISSIFGLSFLYSSILLYNLTNDITAHDLKQLTTYYKLGKLFKETGEECTKEPPFQKISFLVRDWNSSKHSYGEVGGKELLKQKLKTNHITINDFSKCFRQVKCYLMPSIDQTALTQDQGFQGQTTGLNPEFVEHLNSYITGILKELFVIGVLGNDVTAQEFSTYAIQFINLFNSTLEENRTPSVQELCRVRCEAYHDTNKLDNQKYLTEIELNKTKEVGMDQAKSMYKKADKLAEYKLEYLTKLEQQLEDFYESFTKSNTILRTTFVNDCINIANEEYRIELTENFPFDENKITIYDDDDIQAISNMVGEKVTLSFNSQFSKEEMEKLQCLTDSLKQVLKSTFESILEMNNSNKNMANNNLSQLTSEIFRVYETQMQTFMNDFPYFETALLSNFHTMHSKIAINQFDDADKPDDPHIVSQHRERFVTELEKMFNTLNEAQIEKMSTEMKAGISLVNEQSEGLKADLLQKAQEVSSVEELQEHYDIEVESVIQRFKDLNPFPEIASYHEVLNTKLQSQLQLVFDMVKREELVAKRKLEEKLKREGSKCFELYKKGMKTFKNEIEFFDDGRLLEANEENLNSAITCFDEQTYNDADEQVNIHRKLLKSSIEEFFLTLKTGNDAAVKLAKSEAQNWISECLKEYSDAMREPVKSCETTEAFKEEHAKVMFKVTEAFNIKWSTAYKSNEFREGFIEKLENDMDETFAELLDQFQFIKKADMDKTNTVKVEARSYYHDEMETHLKNNQFIQPQVLKSLHERAVQTALERCKVKHALKDTQLTILRQALEKSYKKYEEKNTMILSYEFGTDPAVGIDLGTTYCCVAIFFRGKTTIILSVEGRNTTASYVTFNPDGSIVVGNAAKENAYLHPESTVYDAKRILGRSFQDEQLQNDMQFWPFSVIDGEEGPEIEINNKQYPPVQIAGILLKHLVKQAEKQIGVTIRRAVVTVPAYFTNGQREATKDAAEIAGLDLLQIIDEPTAAALAYKLERFYEDARKVLIFDLGGGTFDISILEMDGGKITVLNKDGDTHLGGEDFDKAMMRYCSDEFKNQHGVDPFVGKDSLQKPERDAAKQRLRRLQSHCERGKMSLATCITTVISIDAFFEAKDLKVTVTRAKFEELNAPYFKKTLDIVERSLIQVGLAKTQIDDIVLVGGSTRIPKVQEMLSDYFGGKALNHTVHPDEAVAYGAAVQAALLNGGNAKDELKFDCIVDVTPMSLGVEAIVDGKPGVFSPIIPKNTKIPTIHKEVYRTAKDNQPSVMVKIFQGESEVAAQNTLLGQFGLTGIPPSPAGKECIDVIMEINTMGVLSVKAVIKSTRGVETLVVNENKPTRISTARKQRVLEESAIGIDLGTTYCCVAVYAKGKIHVVRNSVGKNTTPSYVAFHTNGKETVGDAAKSRAYENPEATIFDAKRIIGRRFDDMNLQHDATLWPFSIVDDFGVPKILIGDKTLHPEEIAAKLLSQLKRDAETYLQRDVCKAVITVPAYFTDGQRQATKDAGVMAAILMCSTFKMNPQQAAIAYKLQHYEGREKNVLIFDLGGGTFDVAVLKMSKGNIDVLAVDGDTHLGGEDFDKNMMNYCAQEFKKLNNIDLFEGKDSDVKQEKDQARRRLKRLQGECERKKIELGAARVTDVIVDRMHGNLDLSVSVTREVFEHMNDSLFQKTIEVVNKDVTPMSIGVEVYGGAFSVIIPKSTKIPVKAMERYRTAHNNQTSVQITIYQGEDRIAVKNQHLGDFYLNGIPPKPAEVENIDVEMVINSQGILHVSAVSSSTGQKSVSIIENKFRMEKGAIQRYLQEGSI
ncbi:Heat shock 70 kDa protein cognate 4, partial [Orchesella cincta]